MKKRISLLLALLMLFVLFPMNVSAQGQISRPAGLEDNAYWETEINNMPNEANPIETDWLVFGQLYPHDLMDHFRFSVKSTSKVTVFAYSDTELLRFGLFPYDSPDVTFCTEDGQMDNGKYSYTLETTVPAGEYYLVFWDAYDRYNYYQFLLVVDGQDSGHVHHHDYTNVIAPTCTEQGYTEHFCICGDTIEQDFVDALGHQFVNGVCTRCDATDENFTDQLQGSCGDNATFQLNADGVLTISGTGAIYNGWGATPYEVTQVVIEPGITEIGGETFDHMDTIEKVSLPDTLEYIGLSAFRSCNALTEITIPGSVTVVGQQAFCNCKGLQTVVLEEGVESMQYGTFANCEYLTELYLPSTFQSFGEFALGSCRGLAAVFYNGTEEEFYNLNIALGNEALANAELIFQQQTHIHQYTEVITDATCVKDGYTIHQCECGDYYGGHVIKALGHDFDDGICLRCGEPDPDYVMPTVPTEPMPTEPEEPENPFTDVKPGDYFYDPVLWAVEENITSGITPTEFGPGRDCTRGQVVTFLWRASGSPEPGITVNPFTDVAPGDYYYKAVLWAVEQGITSGTSKTTFGPKNPCTRAQVATFLWRAKNEPEPQQSASGFTDVKAGDYFFQPVLWAVENGITNGLNATTFGSAKNCTRGQIVTFLYRAESVPSAPEKPQEPEPTEPTEPEPTEPTEPDLSGIDFYPKHPNVPDLGALADAEPALDDNNTYCYWTADVTILEQLQYKNVIRQAGFTFSHSDGGDVFLHNTLDIQLKITTDTQMGMYIVAVSGADSTPGGTEPEPEEPDEPDPPVTYEELRQDQINIKLRIPTNGWMNYYADMFVQNFTGLPMEIPEFVTFNGKLCNLYDPYVLPGFHEVTLSYYRAVIPGDRWDDEHKDMYLDNNSTASMVFEWNGDQYYVEFGVNGIVDFYRGNYKGPATDPVGPDPSTPDNPTTPPSQPEEPTIRYYTDYPAVPDMGAMFGADLAMGTSPGDGTFFYWYGDVDPDAYCQVLEDLGFEFVKNGWGTIIDLSYKLYRHPTLDLTVEAGRQSSPLGKLGYVTIEGADAHKPGGSNGGTGNLTPSGDRGYDAFPAVPDLGAYFGVSPSWSDIQEGFAAYSYDNSDLIAAAGRDVANEYIRLLQKNGFVHNPLSSGTLIFLANESEGLEVVIYLLDSTLDINIEVMD